MYAVDVPVCPDTLPHEPKYSHVGRLHTILSDYAILLLENAAQVGLLLTATTKILKG